MDDLLTQIIASLMAAGAVTLERVAQDGMRVRASAGASSFRRKDTLEACLAEAREQVERLVKQREQADPGLSKRQQSARERAARERVERIERALAYLPEADAIKETQRKRAAKQERGRIAEPRLSTTDPDARVMKMPDGGYRPAYNVQFATDGAYGVILGVDVSNSGSDAHQAPPMLSQLERRTGKTPQAYLIDGGFATRDDITALTQAGVTPYAPIRHPKRKPSEERFLPRYGDTPEVIDWRSRMKSEAGKEMYRARGAIAEWTNAQAGQHGLSSFLVRGVVKTLGVGLLIALAHNLLRWISLLRSC